MGTKESGVPLKAQSRMFLVVQELDIIGQERPYQGLDQDMI